MGAIAGTGRGRHSAQGGSSLREGGVRGQMLATLRRRFVALIMAAVALVITVTFSALCVMEWQRCQMQVEAGLAQAAESAAKAGMFEQDATHPRIGGPGEHEGSGATFTTAVYLLAASDAVSDDGAGLSAELVSGASSASLESDVLAQALAELESRGLVDVTQVAAIEERSDSFASEKESERAERAGLAARGAEGEAVPAMQDGAAQGGAAGGEAGFQQRSEVVALDSLGLYAMVLSSPGGTYVSFASMTAADGWHDLAFALVVAELVVLAAFFGASLLFSRWALRPVEEAWRRQQEFVADASHELKTPLTIILANMAVALKDPAATVASQRRWLESTKREAEDMQGLVGDMLELAGLDAGVSFAGGDRVDLSDLVEGDLLQFESLLFERGVELEQCLEPAIMVKGDRTRLARLVGTLVDNACKYAGVGGRVEVSLSREGKWAVLAVSNDGAAIPAEDLPHVFDRFYRVDKARTRGSETGGSGLGLAIAQEITQSQGGTIAVSSAVDASGRARTTFTVKLPSA